MNISDLEDFDAVILKHIHALLYLYVRSIIDVMHYLAPYLNPNITTKFKPSSNPNHVLTLKLCLEITKCPNFSSRVSISILYKHTRIPTWFPMGTPSLKISPNTAASGPQLLWSC